jgi:hypothetical protein
MSHKIVTKLVLKHTPEEPSVRHGRDEWEGLRAKRQRSARVPENTRENSPKRAGA